MAARQLVFPNDAVAKDVFLNLSRSCPSIPQEGVCRTVLASSMTSSKASYRIRPSKRAVPAAEPLSHLDSFVVAALGGIVEEGSLRFTIGDIMARGGYANPSERGMERTAGMVSASLVRLTDLTIEMSAVAGRGGRKWLDAVPPSPIASICMLGEPRGAATCGEFVPQDPARPLSALPLLLRADQAGQVVGISPGQMPPFSGRRVTLQQRQIAFYLTVRALERGTGPKVLVGTMLEDLGIEFPAGDAGRQARARAIRQITATLEAMSKQGTVIGGYELERERNRVRAIILQPVRAAGK